MEIEIKFKDWSKERLKKGWKTATSRTKPHGKKGDTFTVNSKQYKIHFVHKMPLWFVADNLYETEGAMEPIEFINIWKEIHPGKGWQPEQEVYYHYFTEVI